MGVVKADNQLGGRRMKDFFLKALLVDVSIIWSQRGESVPLM
jgi:hypothetical protein